MMIAIIQKPSPNQSARPAGVSVNCIVLHADASAAVGSSIAWIQHPTSRVSYHYLIGRTGSVYQFVPESRRAWHAGVSEFEGVPNVNDYSIGVSFGNLCNGREPYEDAALTAGAELCAEIIQRHPLISLGRVTTHQAVALPIGRKHDPGPLFSLDDFLARIQAHLR